MNNKNCIVLIHNPIAGWRKRRKLKSVLHYLNESGLFVDVLETEARGDAEAFAAVAERYSLVAVAGGDGTVNEVINGLPANAPPLAFVPLGTANVLACELGIKLQPSAISQFVQNGTSVPVYAGRANGRRFALMVSVGLDAWTVMHVRTALKRKIGALAYVVAVLRLAKTFRYPTYHVCIDGQAYEASTVIITMATNYGGLFVIAPSADLQKPNLTIVIVTGRGLWNMVRYGAAIARGRLHALPDVITVNGQCVSVQGPDNDPVQADGDVISKLPLEVKLDETPYALLVPRSYADSERPT